MEAGKASRSAMGSGLPRAAHVREDRRRGSWWTPLAGRRDYVLLGAGLDTFAWRHPRAGDFVVWEIDHPDTQAWKRAALRRAGLAEPANVRFVPRTCRQASPIWAAITRHGTISPRRNSPSRGVAPRVLAGRARALCRLWMPGPVRTCITSGPRDVIGDEVGQALGDPPAGVQPRVEDRDLQAACSITSEETAEDLCGLLPGNAAGVAVVHGWHQGIIENIDVEMHPESFEVRLGDRS